MASPMDPVAGGAQRAGQSVLIIPPRYARHRSLAAGDLAGEAQPRHRLESQRAVEQLRRIEKRVAVQAAEPRELGAIEARDGAEDPGLLAVLELGLEADHVVERAELVVLAK